MPSNSPTTFNHMILQNRCRPPLPVYVMVAFLLVLLSCVREEAGLAEVPRIAVDSTHVFLSPQTHGLSSPFRVERLPDGRLAVLDPDLFQVRFYHPDGSLDFHVGRQGRGPGEFVAPRGLSINARYVNVLDLSTRMVSQFSHDGTFIRNYIVEREEGFFGFTAMGEGQSYFTIANGRDGHLLRYRDADTDSSRGFGEPLAVDPPPVSQSERYQQAAAAGEVPEALKNDLLMEHHEESLYVVFRNVPLVRRYSGFRQDWEREIDLPVNDIIFEEFVQAFQGAGTPNFRAVRYAEDLAVTDRGFYLLWNAGGEYPQQVVEMSHDGTMRQIYEINSETDLWYHALEVDEERGRIYLLASSAAEVRCFTTHDP